MPGTAMARLIRRHPVLMVLTRRSHPDMRVNPRQHGSRAPIRGLVRTFAIAVLAPAVAAWVTAPTVARAALPDRSNPLYMELENDMLASCTGDDPAPVPISREVMDYFG